MTGYDIFSDIETEINAFSAFYSVSPKRLALLKQHLELLGMPDFTPMKIYDVRWIASCEKAMRIMIKNMKAILSHLTFIANYKWDRKTEPVELFTPSAVAKAQRLRIFFTEKNVLMAMSFNLDVQGGFKEKSLEFQSRYSSLIGQGRREQELDYLLNVVDNGSGENLKKFLEKTVCYQDNPSNGRPCQSIAEYDDSNVQFEGFNLHEVIVKDKNNEDVNKYPKLSIWKSEYLQGIQDQFDAFFPINGDSGKGRVPLRIFDVMDQKTWPVTASQKAAYNPGSIEPIKSLFGVVGDDLQEEFNRVVKEVLFNRKLYCRYKKSPQLLFWSKVLRTIDMKDELKSLLLKVLVIPFSSSDAERR